VVASIVVGLAALAWPLTHSRYLSATVVRVAGTGETSVAAVLDASGLATHPPMVDVDAGSAAARIEALPWVASARVDLEWPDGVLVTVTERTAVAVVADGPGSFAELDATGRVLAVVSGQPPSLVAVVTTARPGAPGTTFASAEPSLVVAAALPAAFRSLVQAVSPSAGAAVDLSLAGGLGVVFGTATQLPEKFEDVASLLAGAALSPGSVIDVSVPDSPVVTPPKATTSP